MTKNNVVMILLIAMSGMTGLVLGQAININAQNTTSTSEQFGESGAGLVTAISSIVISITGLVTVLVKAGILDKKIGTVAVMTGDTMVAVRDSRQSFKEGLQNAHETIKLANPELADRIDQKVTPTMDMVTERVSEYSPKVDKFTDIIKPMGKKTTEEIKEVEHIPKSVSPS